MLAQRKEEFALYEMPVVREPAVKSQPIVNKKLRMECLIFIVVFAVLAMVTTLRSGTIVAEGYALVRGKMEVSKLEQENERLRLEIAQMRSPQRIQQIAVSELGMVIPDDVYFAPKKGQ